MNSMIGEYMKVRMICLTICFLFTGCSYGMDMLEGAITDRASFSINASYDSGYLRISWSASPSEECFAGYEVYMIPEPWNEFGTYEVIAARYTLYPSSSRFFRTMPELGTRSTRYVNIPVSKSDLRYGEGEYYVRFGIIKMDKEDKDDSEACYPVDSANYINNSSLDKISGYKAVYIY